MRTSSHCYTGMLTRLQLSSGSLCLSSSSGVIRRHTRGLKRIPIYRSLLPRMLRNQRRSRDLTTETMPTSSRKKLHPTLHRPSLPLRPTFHYPAEARNRQVLLIRDRQHPNVPSIRFSSTRNGTEESLERWGVGVFGRGAFVKPESKRMTV